MSRRRVGLAAFLLLLVTATAAVMLTRTTTSHHPAVAQAADGCAAMPLEATLAEARHAGASVVEAQGTLTGRTVAQDGPVYHQMVLRAVTTLSGPAVPDGTQVWVSAATGPSGPIPGADSGALWSKDGRLFAILWRNQAPGPTLRIAPMVANDVIFSSAGCWDTAGLPGRPFTGPLSEVPGSGSYARAAHTGGFHAVPRATIESLARG